MKTKCFNNITEINKFAASVKQNGGIIISVLKNTDSYTVCYDSIAVKKILICSCSTCPFCINDNGNVKCSNTNALLDCIADNVFPSECPLDNIS